jgi:murein L,D-transpeptidase YafK
MTVFPMPRFSRRAFCTSVAAIIIIGTGCAIWAAGYLASACRLSQAAEPLVVGEPRVVIVKSSSRLYLFDGDTLVRSYAIKLGPAPVGPKRRAGDGRTPEGRFTVCTKRTDSPFHRFLGINYPDPATAERGLRAGRISTGEAQAIREAHDEGRCPSWRTALGGGIGLHGSAQRVERTAGCVALRDEHIDELFNVLRVGDEIEILP